ncbi:MAG: DUF3343 domain-containing protein [Clostridia bacterium]|nr:DUF3343 domain-containing protein [Clostridia bacterium]
MRYIAVFPTLTLAQKAARVLKNEKIAADVIKVDSTRTRRGCSWGVAFDESKLLSVRMAFSNNSVAEREIIKE